MSAGRTRVAVERNVRRIGAIAMAGLVVLVGQAVCSTAANAAAGGCSKAGFSRTFYAAYSSGGVETDGYRTEPAYYCTAYQSNKLLNVVPGGGPGYDGAILYAGK